MENTTIHHGTDERAALENLLVRSAGTDVPVLLQAKEVAKRLVKNDPSSANLAAFQRATTMLENAMHATTETSETFKTTGAVLRYLQEAGRKIEKTKLYDDAKKGLLRKEKGGFRKRDVDRYAASLPLASTPDGRNKDAEDRLRRKEEADIRIKEATARREELKTAIMEGRYVLREQVDQELAARAMALNMGLKSHCEASALDFVTAVGGKAKKAHALVQLIERTVDAACNEYAREIEFEVNLHADDIDDEGQEPCATAGTDAEE